MSRLDRSRVLLQGIALGVWRWAVPTAAILLSTFLLVQLYYAVMPGSWFLKFDTASVTASVAGEDVVSTVCRTRKIGAVEASAVRTFYRSDTADGTFQRAGQYSFNPEIEDGERCVIVPIESETFSHTEGFWRYHTDLRFKVSGWEKSTGFDSNVYRVLPRPSNEELQIRLERRIDDLQRQLDELKQQAGMSPAATTASSPTTAQTNQPTTSSPPETQAQTAAQPQSQPEETQHQIEERTLMDVLVREVFGVLR